MTRAMQEMVGQELAQLRRYDYAAAHLRDGRVLGRVAGTLRIENLRSYLREIGLEDDHDGRSEIWYRPPRVGTQPLVRVYVSNTGTITGAYELARQLADLLGRPIHHMLAELLELAGLEPGKDLPLDLPPKAPLYDEDDDE